MNQFDYLKYINKELYESVQEIFKLKNEETSL